MANWILSNGGILMFIVFAAGGVARYIDYRHIKENRYHRGDLGYFWRLMKSGDRDGIIVAVMSVIVLCAGMPLVFALLSKISSK